MGHRVPALLLAAGLSSRMGRTKQLLLLDDKPIIRHCVEALIAAHVTDIVVVVNTAGERITETLSDLPVTVVVNDTPDSDMAESVRTGLAELDNFSSGVLVCLSDHPLVDPLTIKRLMVAHDEAPDKIIIPCYEGRRGHPSLFPRTVLDEIFFGTTLRDIIRSDDRRVLPLPVPDKGVVIDIDTYKDYRNVVEMVVRKK